MSSASTQVDKITWTNDSIVHCSMLTHYSLRFDYFGIVLHDVPMIALFLCCISCFPHTVYNFVFMPLPCPISATDKVALLIGNMSYQNHPQLKAPMVDVYDLTNLLHQLNFKVVSLLDLTEAEMRNTVEEFLLLLHKGVYGMLVCHILYLWMAPDLTSHTWKQPSFVIQRVIQHWILTLILVQ